MSDKNNSWFNALIDRCDTECMALIFFFTPVILICLTVSLFVPKDEKFIQIKKNENRVPVSEKLGEGTRKFKDGFIRGWKKSDNP